MRRPLTAPISRCLAGGVRAVLGVAFAVLPRQPPSRRPLTPAGARRDAPRARRRLGRALRRRVHFASKLHPLVVASLWLACSWPARPERGDRRGGPDRTARRCLRWLAAGWPAGADDFISSCVRLGVRGGLRTPWRSPPLPPPRTHSPGRIDPLEREWSLQMRGVRRAVFELHLALLGIVWAAEKFLPPLRGAPRPHRLTGRISSPACAGRGREGRLG